MSIACDFCLKQAERNEDIIFLAAPSGLAHICEECVADCLNVIARKKLPTDSRPPNGTRSPEIGLKTGDYGNLVSR